MVPAVHQEMEMSRPHHKVAFVLYWARLRPLPQRVDIIQEITGGEGIKTLREFVSSWEKRNYEKRLTRWIDRNVPSCQGRRVEISRLKLSWKAGFDRKQND